MSTAFLITMISGSLLALCFILFAFESNEGRRLVLVRVRSMADIKLIGLQARLQRQSQHWHGFSFRTLLHYILHQLLGLMLYIIRGVESYLNRLRRHNKVIAQASRSVGVKTHLSHIAEHKENVTLSDQEKTALKNRALHGENQ